MDLDDLMLNITVNKNKGQIQNTSRNQSMQIGKKMSKTDMKKMKYSAKMKMRTNMSKSINKNSNRSIVPSPQATQTNKTFNKHPHIQKQESKIKIQEYQQQQSKNKYSRKDRQRKINNSQQKPERRRARKQMGARSKGQFNAELRKNVVVQQLMPSENMEQNCINTNQLEYFNLQPKLKDSLQKSGVAKLTEIQKNSYQSLVNGVDSIIKASTGSGKTLAYLIPLVNRIIKTKSVTKRDDGVCVMIICPTRQLCVQGQKQANRCLKRCPFIISGCLYGGQETNHEKSRLRKGTNILFCTPGRVLYHLENTQSFKLNNLNALVFQQADRTLDMGFHDSVKKILSICSSKIAMSHIHKILVSAHFNSKVSDLLQQLQMNSPKFIGFQNLSSQMQLQKLKQSKDVQINTSSQLKQQYVLMSQQQKIPLMLAYLSVLKNCKVLIFVSTIDEVQFFDYLLTNLKYRDSNGGQTNTRFQTRPVYKIHGDLDQKLRSKTYLEFRESKQAILISTQVASRGLDFPDLSHIILYDVPPTITDYGNRVGRSARFNQTGVSLLMLHYIESDYAEKIRYYVPNLQVIEKDIIYDNFQKVLRSMNIGDNSLHYIQGIIRSSVKNDDEKYTVARKAYVSMLKAYARHPDRQVFAVKKLNLKLLARSFGLNNAQAGTNYNPKAKNSHLQASRKKRKVQDVKKLQFSQYM